MKMLGWSTTMWCNRMIEIKHFLETARPDSFSKWTRFYDPYLRCRWPCTFQSWLGDEPGKIKGKWVSRLIFDIEELRDPATNGSRGIHAIATHLVRFLVVSKIMHWISRIKTCIASILVELTHLVLLYWSKISSLPKILFSTRQASSMLLFWTNTVLAMNLTCFILFN